MAGHGLEKANPKHEFMAGFSMMYFGYETS
jgi:hypothetical protein